MRTSNMRIGGSIALRSSQRLSILPSQPAAMKPHITTTSAARSAPLWLMKYSISLSCQAGAMLVAVLAAIIKGIFMGCLNWRFAASIR